MLPADRLVLGGGREVDRFNSIVVIAKNRRYWPKIRSIIT